MAGYRRFPSHIYPLEFYNQSLTLLDKVNNILTQGAFLLGNIRVLSEMTDITSLVKWLSV